jgi:hypothetical protein
MLNWIKYSGASISITVNPYHWRWTPVAREAFIDEWVGPYERSWYIAWLFLTVRIWIDNGSW